MTDFENLMVLHQFGSQKSLQPPASRPGDEQQAGVDEALVKFK